MTMYVHYEIWYVLQDDIIHLLTIEALDMMCIDQRILILTEAKTVVN